MIFLLELKEIIKDIVNYGLPIIAFAISIYSVVESQKANKLNNRVMELEKEIKELQLENIRNEIEESKKACVEARIIKESNNKYTLKIWNSGKATALNINFNYENEVAMIWQEKVPYEFLDPGKNFEEKVIRYPGLADKFILQTTWEDQNGNRESKDNMISY